MREQNKYTHLIERVPGLAKELASSTVKEITGMTPSACYWRLRAGKGLLNLYDQESLAMWSRLLADIRRYTGSPIRISPVYVTGIKIHRIKLLKRMEAYRTWLEHGAIPTYHSYQYACSDDTWRYAIIHYAVAHHLQAKGYDLCTPPDQSIWTMPAEERAELRQQRRAMVRDVIDTLAIDWPEVYTIAADMAAIVQEEQDRLDRMVRQLEEDASRPGLSMDDVNAIYKRIEYVRQTSPLRVLHKDYSMLYEDEIWQIRTDFDCRSSAGAAINGRLLWIHDVPTISAEHREIYEHNKAVLESFRAWKAKKKADAAQRKKKPLYKIEEEEEATYKEIIGFLSMFEVPFVPIPKKEEASLTD